MSTKLKFGLITGAGGSVLGACGVCGMLLSLIIGAIAGLLTVNEEKPTEPKEGALSGAKSGIVAGVFLLLGALVGNTITLILGAMPSDLSQWVLDLTIGIILGLVLGLADLAFCVLGGAIVGYIATSARIDKEMAEAAKQMKKNQEIFQRTELTSLKCVICGKDLSGLPTMVDSTTGEAYCEQDAHFIGIHPSNRPKPLSNQGEVLIENKYSKYTNAVIYCKSDFNVSSLRLPGFTGNAEVVRSGNAVTEAEIVTYMLLQGCDKDNILVSAPDYGVGFIN